MATSHSLFVRRVDPGNGCCDVDFSPIKVVKVLKALKPKNSLPAMVYKAYLWTIWDAIF